MEIKQIVDNFVQSRADGGQVGGGDLVSHLARFLRPLGVSGNVKRAQPALGVIDQFQNGVVNSGLHFKIVLKGSD